MAIYSVNNRMAGTQQNLSTTFKTLINVVGSAQIRVRLWEFAVGADSAPNATDCQIVWDIATKDSTTAGTGTAATVQKINPADGNASCTVNVNYTVEATTYTSVYDLALNQRASQRWTAISPDQAIIMASTANLGLGIRALSPTYAAPALAQALYEEI